MPPPGVYNVAAFVVALPSGVAVPTGSSLTEQSPLLTWDEGLLLQSLLVASLLVGLALFAVLLRADAVVVKRTNAARQFWTAGGGPSKDAPCTTSASGLTVPDFSGKWLLTDLLGDVDGFVQDVGERGTAGSYVVGQHTCEIKQVHDKLCCRSSPSGYATDYSVDQRPQQTVDMSAGNAINVVPSWGDGGASLVCVGWDERTGRAIPRTKRFYRSGQMVLTLVSMHGTSIQRVYTRQTEGGDAGQATSVAAEPPDQDFSGVYEMAGFEGDMDGFVKDVGQPLIVQKGSKFFNYQIGMGLPVFVDKAPGGGYICTWTIDHPRTNACRCNLDLTQNTRFVQPHSDIWTGTPRWLPGGFLHCDLRNSLGQTRFVRISMQDADTFVGETCGLYKKIPIKNIFKRYFPRLVPNLAAPVKVDFSGHWQLQEIRNPQYWDEQLAWHGLGSARIFMQRRSGYNVGKDFLEIWQHHDVISITAPHTGVIMYFRTDGSPTPMGSVPIRKICFDPVLSGIIATFKYRPEVCIKFCPDGLRLAIHITRYPDDATTELILEMEGEKLVMTCSVVEGQVSQKVFVRTGWRDKYALPTDGRG